MTIGKLVGGRYQIQANLGTGGFGKTYLAIDLHIPGHPYCALKHLSPLSSELEFIETARNLFKKEAEILVKLGNHDRIPALLAYFEENCEFYLAQEYIEGNSLSQEIGAGKIWTSSQVIDLLKDILEILVFVGERGAIHRDIKPDNIIRRKKDCKLVLIDFGAIKQIPDRSLNTADLINKTSTIAIGTLGYMPMEQAQGKPRPNSDLYALGVTCIQALTGKHPSQFSEDSDGELIWQPGSPISDSLTAFLNKMTRSYFKYRFQSAKEALQVLETIIPNNHQNYLTLPSKASTTINSADLTVSLTTNPDGNLTVPVKRSAKIPLLLSMAIILGAIAGGILALQSQKILPSISLPKIFAIKTCSVQINGNIRNTPASFQANIIKKVRQETLEVTGVQTRGGWIQVKVDKNTLGWAHRYVMSNDAEMDLCLKNKDLKVEIVADLSRPKTVVQPKKTRSKPIATIFKKNTPKATPTSIDTPTPTATPTPIEKEKPQLEETTLPKAIEKPQLEETTLPKAIEIPVEIPLSTEKTTPTPSFSPSPAPSNSPAP
jgi:serine/threonine-protein kinase